MNAPVLSDGVIVQVYARTDVGMRRQGNEDSFLVADLSTGRLGLGPEVTTHQLGINGSLMVVSDGLGGAAAGEVASAMAVQTICTELMKSTKSVLSASDRLKRATEAANDQIWTCAQSDNSLKGMGATLTAAFVHDNTVYIAQVGDSRAYIIRGGQVKQVTEDQSWANAVKKAGLESKDVPHNVILQALGTQPRVHVEVTSVELRSGDSLLLCSDGLSNKLKDTEMRELVANAPDLPEACRQLIDLANKRGGEDNITVIIARFVGETLAAQLEPGSITSTFKVVTPLDFSETMDANETMSFREPIETEAALSPDHVPTLSDLPKIPDLPDPAGTASYPAKPPELPSKTSPLTGEPLPKNTAKDLPKWRTETKPQVKFDEAMAADRKGDTAAVVDSEAKTAPLPSAPPPPKPGPKPASKPASKEEFEPSPFASTKPDLPSVPVFELKQELKPKPKPEPEKESEPKPLPEPKAKPFEPKAKPSPTLPPPPKPKESPAEFPFLTPMATPSSSATPPNQAKPAPPPAKPASPPAKPASPSAASSLFTSTPGLFYSPAELSDTPPASSDPNDDTEPLMFETLSIVGPPEEKKPEEKKSAPPAVSTAPPKLTEPTAAAPPPLPKVQPTQTDSADVPPKPKPTGPEVLASLFSAPPPSKSAPAKTEPPKPVAPPTVPPLTPAAPKNLEAKPTATAPSKPPLSAPPTKPAEGGDRASRLFIGEPKTGDEAATPLKPEPLFKPEPVGPKPSSLFSPPPVNKPAVPPPSAKGAVPPVQLPKAEPPKTELPKVEPPKKAEPPKVSPPPLSKPAPPVKAAPPVQAPPVQAPPIQASSSASSFDFSAEPPKAAPPISGPPPVRATPPQHFADVSSLRAVPEERRLNPKLLAGLGGALVLVIAVSIGIISHFTGQKESGQARPTPPAVKQTTTPPSTQKPPDTPVTEAPPTTPSSGPATTPATSAIPSDTPSLVKYALNEVNETIERVQNEMSDSDPSKESRLQNLTGFKQKLEEYDTQGSSDSEARNYAESALSQVKSIRTQLDRAPKPPAKK